MKKDTCEIRYYKYKLALALILNFISIVFIIFISRISRFAEEDFLLIVIAIFSPFTLIYSVYKLIYYRKLKPLYIQEVKLEKVESFFWHYVCFSIQLEINGGKREVKTLAIFRAAGLIGPNLVDKYSNKKALVGYDEKKGNAIVLTLVD